MSIFATRRLSNSLSLGDPVFRFSVGDFDEGMDLAWFICVIWTLGRLLMEVPPGPYDMRYRSNIPRAPLLQATY